MPRCVGVIARNLLIALRYLRFGLFAETFFGYVGARRLGGDFALTVRT